MKHIRGSRFGIKSSFQLANRDAKSFGASSQDINLFINKALVLFLVILFCFRIHYTKFSSVFPLSRVLMLEDWNWLPLSGVPRL